ncbi:hypothetical protein FOZ63_006021 [Perkinsus olseni]|uniref:Uncharacterized protein n=1 Tax=Perkinsus olseni TaxID=32597 RepID=A0A7J6UEY8_PEROL|nr:hypothetical protein FOZ63_006021 [Perkinsus olseni]KAF4755683.1 hypothetical protein FOZ62_029068 [Perkinsus olseni]
MPRRSAALRRGPTHELCYQLGWPDMTDLEGFDDSTHQNHKILKAFFDIQDEDGCTGPGGLKCRSEDYRSRAEPCKMFLQPRYKNKRGKIILARSQESPMVVDSETKAWFPVHDRHSAAKASWPGLCADVNLPMWKCRNAQELRRARVSYGSHLRAVPKDAVMGFRPDYDHDTASLVLALYGAKYVIDAPSAAEIESDLAAIATGSAGGSIRPYTFQLFLSSCLIFPEQKAFYCCICTSLKYTTTNKGVRCRVRNGDFFTGG